MMKNLLRTRSHKLSPPNEQMAKHIRNGRTDRLYHFCYFLFSRSDTLTIIHALFSRLALAIVLGLAFVMIYIFLSSGLLNVLCKSIEQIFQENVLCNCMYVLLYETEKNARERERECDFVCVCARARVST